MVLDWLEYYVHFMLQDDWDVHCAKLRACKFIYAVIQSKYCFHMIRLVHSNLTIAAIFFQRK